MRVYIPKRVNNTGSYRYQDSKWRVDYGSEEALIDLIDIVKMGDATELDQTNFIYTLKCYFALLYREANVLINQPNKKLNMRILNRENKDLIKHPNKAFKMNGNEKKIENEIPEITNLKLNSNKLLSQLKLLRDSCTVNVFMMDMNELTFEQVVERTYQRIKSIIAQFEVKEDPNPPLVDSQLYIKSKEILEEVTDSLEFLKENFDILFPKLSEKVTYKP